MAKPSEAELIEIRLEELRLKLAEQEAIVTELWIKIIDLRSRRAAILEIEDGEDGDDLN